MTAEPRFYLLFSRAFLWTTTQTRLLIRTVHSLVKVSKERKPSRKVNFIRILPISSWLMILFFSFSIYFEWHYYHNNLWCIYFWQVILILQSWEKPQPLKIPRPCQLFEDITNGTGISLLDFCICFLLICVFYICCFSRTGSASELFENNSS